MSLYEDEEKTSVSTLIYWLGAIAVVAAIGYFGWREFNKESFDKVTLCPSKGAVGQYVVLIDNTSPFPFNQKVALAQRLKTMVSTEVPEGALVTIFLLGEDYKHNDEPVFEKCNPGQWKDSKRMDAAKKFVEKDFNEKFAKPLDAVVRQISLDQTSKTSPIFEMLQLAGIKGFQRANVEGERQLIIYSDMVANMPQFSMYKSSLPSYKDFANTPYGRDSTAPSLEGAVVTINMLAAESSAATYLKRSEFWARYFEANHATLEHVYPMEGL
ncbi:hypothetical protein J2X84_001990 [Pseudomonas corrugata]|uniref:hypothetical protein n=1 Tax=Pseudomonas corrugata TaxID=47879 RepID=UPI00285DD765|nr:hypothetical protein [Pseudomonas corrugata]MDR7283166.1 hypothetical protein [Pseudomonas corrugata]